MSMILGDPSLRIISLKITQAQIYVIDRIRSQRFIKYSQLYWPQILLSQHLFTQNNLVTKSYPIPQVILFFYYLVVSFLIFCLQLHVYVFEIDKIGVQKYLAKLKMKLKDAVLLVRKYLDGRTTVSQFFSKVESWQANQKQQYLFKNTECQLSSNLQNQVSILQVLRFIILYLEILGKAF